MENYGRPAPVSLQPHKTLKIVFLALAIATTVITAVLFVYFFVLGGALGALFSSAHSDYAAAGGIVSAIGTTYMLFYYLPFVIAFWVLYGAFNSKYKARVAENRALGYDIQ